MRFKSKLDFMTVDEFEDAVIVDKRRGAREEQETRPLSYWIDRWAKCVARPVNPANAYSRLQSRALV
jgi:hypothetical protein